MSGPAYVHSTAAIEEFRGALSRFGERIASVLENLDGQLRRAQEWVEHDLPSHWRSEIRNAEDLVQAAKLELEKCLMLPVADERPSCREERTNLRSAEERRDYCRAKLQRVRHWNHQFRHEQFEFQGRTGQLRRWLETDLERALICLRQILQRLDAYGAKTDAN